MGLLLLQGIKYAWARATGTVSTQENGRVAREAGAADVIVYTKIIYGKLPVALIRDKAGTASWQITLASALGAILLLAGGGSSSSGRADHPGRAGRRRSYPGYKRRHRVRPVAANADQHSDCATMKSQISGEEKHYGETSLAVVRGVLGRDAGCNADLRQS
jgi:hypothetical protein